MEDTIFTELNIVSELYTEFDAVCKKLAMKAQKHIDWNQNVGYAYIINDGIYIEIEGNICPATKFFQLIELIGNDMIDEHTFKSNCI